MKEDKTKKYSYESYKNENFSDANKKLDIEKLSDYIVNSNDITVIEDGFYELISSSIYSFDEFKRLEKLQFCLIELAKNEKNYKSFVTNIAYYIGEEYQFNIEIMNLEGKINFTNKNTNFLKLAYRDYLNSILIKNLISQSGCTSNVETKLLIILSEYKVSYPLFDLMYELNSYRKVQIELVDIICNLFESNLKDIYKDCFEYNRLDSWLKNFSKIDTIEDEDTAMYDKFIQHCDNKRQTIKNLIL